MNEDKKNLNEEALNEVSGGVDLASLKQELLDKIPSEVKQKLATAKSDIEACRILVENNINVEEIEKKIVDAGLNLKRIGLQLSDDLMDKINGGYVDKDFSSDVKCECGNANRDDFSKQIFASLLASNAKAFYRCKKCNKYVIILNDGRITYTDDIDWF